MANVNESKPPFAIVIKQTLVKECVTEKPVIF